MRGEPATRLCTNMNMIVCNEEQRRQGRTVNQMVLGASLAITGLSNQGKAWQFLKNLLIKIEGGHYSSLILKHLKK